VVNNTPLVAVLIPAVVDISRRTRISPSRLLLPLSYAAMLGGTLTLLGTSMNLLASDLSGRLLGHPIGLLEFTPLGLVVVGVGGLYLLTVGRRLVPARIRPEEDLTQRFDMRGHLRRVRVPAGSPLAGAPLEEVKGGEEYALDVLQVVRGRRVYPGPTTDQALNRGDLLTLRAAPETAERFARDRGLELLPREEVTDGSFVDAEHTLVEVVVSMGSEVAGETPVSSDFRRRFGGTVLAIRRPGRVVRDHVEAEELREGDALLLLIERDAMDHLEDRTGVEITATSPAAPPAVEDGGGSATERQRKTPVALSIVAGVVAVAAAGITPIYIAALGGVVLMVATGCLSTGRAYEAVSWDVVFLLAGILPLGMAMADTGAARYLAAGLLEVAGGLPPVVVLGLFYLFTAAITNVVSANASVVLMIPVAVDAATRIGADPFPFLLAVTFAAATAFTTPVGYQTNLMVYAPGGYRFSDYVRVGAPLQLLLAVVTPLAISLIWGL
jgi:di/tricarboxylate transporter